jgi:VanZ family protein
VTNASRIAFLRWTSYALYSAALALLCLAPSEALPETPYIFPHADKLAHVLAFGAHAFLFLRATRSRSRAVLILAFLVTIGYSTVLEFLQPRLWTQTRSFDVMDILANALGAMLACRLTSHRASAKLLAD